MCSQLPNCVCDAEDPRNPLDEMLQDVLDGVEQFWGKEGLQQVAEFAVARNRSRESNRVMDELERLYGPFPDDVKGAPDHG
jgi:hypothetical protein